MGPKQANTVVVYNKTGFQVHFPYPPPPPPGGTGKMSNEIKYIFLYDFYANFYILLINNLLFYKIKILFKS